MKYIYTERNYHLFLCIFSLLLPSCSTNLFYYLRINGNKNLRNYFLSWSKLLKCACNRKHNCFQKILSIYVFKKSAFEKIRYYFFWFFFFCFKLKTMTQEWKMLKRTKIYEKIICCTKNVQFCARFSCRWSRDMLSQHKVYPIQPMSVMVCVSSRWNRYGPRRCPHSFSTVRTGCTHCGIQQPENDIPLVSAKISNEQDFFYYMTRLSFCLSSELLTSPYYTTDDIPNLQESVLYRQVIFLSENGNKSILVSWNSFTRKKFSTSE